MTVDSKAQSPLDVLRQNVNPALVTRGKVVIIGLGGIGLYLVRGVTTFFSGILQSAGPEASIELFLCDGDDFQIENTYRMDVPDFGNKAEVLATELLGGEIAGLNVRWLPEFISEKNIGTVIEEGDCVLLACDNHKTRHIVGRYCASDQLKNVVLISGGNDGIENGNRGTYGNVQVHVRRDGRDVTAPLEQFHPEIAEPQDVSPDDQHCLEAIATGAAQISIVNMAVASAMCNALLRLLMTGDEDVIYDEVALDAYNGVSVAHWITHPDKDDAA